MNETNTPLVSIRCITYNHEKYIRDALEGFVMQKTNFKFEAIVHDDASTDNTAAIIQEYAEKYPEIIKPIFETENQYSKHDGSLTRIMNAACKGKYIALCEGDDYWIDPYKLQKQVDLMENNPNCSLCYHACKNIYEDESCTPFGETVKETYNALYILNYPFQTATVLIKKEVLLSDIYQKAIATKCLSGDILLFLSASTIGTMKGINEQMSVYRRHKNGASINMWNKNNLYNHYVSWVKVGNLFGNEIKKNIEENRLKSFLVTAILGYKDIKLTLKLLYYGMFHNPRSIYLGLMTILRRGFSKIKKKVRDKRI